MAHETTSLRVETKDRLVDWKDPDDAISDAVEQLLDIAEEVSEQ